MNVQLVVSLNFKLARVVVAMGSRPFLLCLEDLIDKGVFLLLLELAGRELPPVSDSGVLG